MGHKRFHIQTIGCQMNVYDADLMANGLMTLGYRPAAVPEAADLVIVNTCAIRQKAEQKVYSLLGRLAGLKRRRPGLRIAVGGCVAQQAGARMLRRAPYIDLVFGTQAVVRLPRLVARLDAGETPLVDVAMVDGPIEIQGPRRAVVQDGVTRFVTVMQGCDNYCAYCVVPYVRGREASRKPEQIVEEVRALADQGVREVTLLGQNVNSYGIKEGWCTFAELLARVADVPGLARLRFTTSHPKDLSAELIRAFAEIEALCPHIHLPVQSGSDRILKRMNRRYDRAAYLDRVARLRAARPGIALTSDIIVGFPGESEDDFAQTLDLVERVRFDGLFAFNYSDRPPAPASRLAGKVPPAVQGRRLAILLERQARIGLELQQALRGTVQEVLVEGVSRRADGAGVPPEAVQWMGRTPGNKIVNFAPPPGGGPLDGCLGALWPVRIEEAFAHSLRGTCLGPAAVPVEACHAA